MKRVIIGFLSILIVVIAVMLYRSDLIKEVGAPDKSESAQSTTPEAVMKAGEYIKKQLNIKENENFTLEASEKNWPDACLGINEPGLMCAQVITPGYEVRVRYKGALIILRTNKSGSVIKEVQTW